MSTIEFTQPEMVDASPLCSLNLSNDINDCRSASSSIKKACNSACSASIHTGASLLSNVSSSYDAFLKDKSTCTRDYVFTPYPTAGPSTSDDASCVSDCEGRFDDSSSCYTARSDLSNRGTTSSEATPGSQSNHSELSSHYSMVDMEDSFVVVFPTLTPKKYDWESFRRSKQVVVCHEVDPCRSKKRSLPPFFLQPAPYAKRLRRVDCYSQENISTPSLMSLVSSTDSTRAPIHQGAFVQESKKTSVLEKVVPSTRSILHNTFDNFFRRPSRALWELSTRPFRSKQGERNALVEVHPIAKEGQGGSEASDILEVPECPDSHEVPELPACPCSCCSREFSLEIGSSVRVPSRLAKRSNLLPRLVYRKILGFLAAQPKFFGAGRVETLVKFLHQDIDLENFRVRITPWAVFDFIAARHDVSMRYLQERRLAFSNESAGEIVQFLWYNTGIPVKDILDFLHSKLDCKNFTMNELLDVFEAEGISSGIDLMALAGKRKEDNLLLWWYNALRTFNNGFLNGMSDITLNIFMWEKGFQSWNSVHSRKAMSLCYVLYSLPVQPTLEQMKAMIYHRILAPRK